MPDQTGTGQAPAKEGPVQVTITFEDSKAKNSITVTPGEFVISMQKGEQVEWICNSHDFTVEFKDGPFHFDDGKKFGKKGIKTPSGRATRPGHFKYKVRIGDNVLDPTGQVDR